MAAVRAGDTDGAGTSAPKMQAAKPFVPAATAAATVRTAGFRGQHPLTQPMQPVSPPPVMPADVLPGSSMCRRAWKCKQLCRAAGTSADGGNRGDSTAQPGSRCRWRRFYFGGYLAAVIAGSVYLPVEPETLVLPAMSAPSALRQGNLMIPVGRSLVSSDLARSNLGRSADRSSTNWLKWAVSR